MKRAILILAMVALSAILNPVKASAATYFLDFAVTGTGACTDTGWYFPLSNNWNVPAEAITLTIVEVDNGVTTYNATIGTGFAGSGGGTGYAYSYGSFTATQPYTTTLTIQYAAPSLGIFSAWRFQGSCVGGVFTVTASNLSGGGDAPAGPSIPDGYVLKTITCTEAVFDSPGGNPVGDNKVTAGQTFYVSPKSVKGADGRMWSQIFVSSYSNPYILTSCAQ